MPFRRRKNLFWISLILMLLVSTAMVNMPVSSMPGPTLSAPILIDKGLIDDGDPATAEFYVNITIADVTAMWGFEFKLRYDTNVLTAISHSSYDPFFIEYPSEINDLEGYVWLAYSMNFGEDKGFNATVPAPIARIDFSVDSLGTSPLSFSDVEIRDIYAGLITTVAVDGYFTNIVGYPVASFNWSPETPIEGETVTFTSTSTDPDGTIDAWDWSFGDGATGTGSETTHAYGEEGTYTVTLTVTDNDGKTDSDSKTINVLGIPTPGAIVTRAKVKWRHFNYWAKGTSLNPLTARVKNLDTEEATIVRVIFMIYDASMSNLGAMEVNGTIPPGSEKIFQVGFNFTEPRWDYAGPDKEYRVSAAALYVDYWLTPEQPHWAPPDPHKEWFSLVVMEKPPVASFTWAPTTPVKSIETVTFDASASYDPDGTISYEWDFGDGTSGENMIELHVYEKPGTYTVTLTVTDDFGAQDSASADIEVVGPMAVFTWTPEVPRPHRTVTFDGSASYDTYGTIVVYVWDFGDGTFGTDVIATHKYTAEGTYTVTLTITDDLGVTDSVSADITVAKK